MGQFTKEINDYLAERARFLEQEKSLFSRIKDELEKELHSLELKVGDGYKIDEFGLRINATGQLEAYFMRPYKKMKGSKKNVLVNDVYLNDILREEYERIQEKYGINVVGFNKLPSSISS